MKLSSSLFLDRRVRYIITGCTSFITEYGSFLLLVYLLFTATWIAQAISYCIGLIVNFTLLRLWAFSGASGGNLSVQLPKYGILVAVNLPATSYLMGVLTGYGLEPLVSKVVVVATAAVWNFVIYDKVIFKQKFSTEDIV